MLTDVSKEIGAMSTGVTWLVTSKDYIITSEKNCFLKNDCAVCPYFRGKFDTVIVGNSNQEADVQHGSLILKEATQEVMMVVSAAENIYFSGFPVIVCDRPQNSIMYIKELESA